MRLPLLALVALMAPGCRPACTISTGCNPVPYERGLQLFPSPRDFDAPGTIFRIDAYGVRHLVVDLSGMLTLPARTEAITTVSLVDRFRGGVIASYLGKDSLSFSDSTRDSIVVSATGTRREIASDVQLRPVVDSALKVISWRPRNRYYIITETVLADSVKYLLDKEAAIDLGGAATIGTVVMGKPSLSWRSEGPRYALEARFAKPLRVFYKVQLLTPEGAALGGGAFSATREPVTERILWVRETRL